MNQEEIFVMIIDRHFLLLKYRTPLPVLEEWAHPEQFSTIGAGITANDETSCSRSLHTDSPSVRDSRAEKELSALHWNCYPSIWAFRL